MKKYITILSFILTMTPVSYAKYFEIKLDRYRIYLFDVEVDFNEISEYYEDFTVKYSVDNWNQMNSLENMLSKADFNAINYYFKNSENFYVFNDYDVQSIPLLFLKQLGDRIHIIYDELN